MGQAVFHICASVVCLLAGVACAETACDLPVFRSDALSPELVAESRDEVPVRIERLKKRIARQRTDIEDAIGRRPGSFQYVRAMKRMVLASRAAAFSLSEHSRNCLDGYAFALMAAEDLKKLSEAFDEELALWKEYPLAPGVTPAVFRVADFGAKGDGMHDDGPAFRAAVSNATALAGRPSVIEIPEGTFYFAPRPPLSGGRKPAQLRICGLTNCVMRGVSPEKTRLRLGDYDASGCVLIDCRNVTVANLEIAGSEPSFAQGTVLEFDKAGGWVRIRHQPESMLPDDARLVNGFKMQVLGIYDENRRQVLYQEMFYANRTDDLGGGEYKVYLQKDHFIYKRASSCLKPGWTITVGDRNNTIPSASVTRGSSWCNFENVHILSSRSAALNFMDSLYPTAWRVKIRPLRPELVQSSDADAIFSYRGEFIGECEVRNLGDDAFNCMVRGRNIDCVENGDTVVADWLPGHYESGDLFQIIRPTTGEFVYLGRVRRPGLGDGAKHDTQFWGRLPELFTYKSLGKSRLSKEECLAINIAGRKSTFSPDQMYRPYAFGIGFVVTGCTISDLRGTGCVVGASNALIENNVFEYMNRGVGISCLSNCTEGPVPYNVLVRNNVFRHVGTAIESRFIALGGGRIRTAPIRGVRIEGNQYEDVARNLVSDFCGDDIKVAVDDAADSR